jgi:translation initiation factor eIF-2B subunit beta
VLVGAHAVLANGGVIAPAGVHMVALAAKRHSIPFVVLVGLHKLSPLFPHDPDVTFNGAWRTIQWRGARVVAAATVWA